MQNRIHSSEACWAAIKAKPTRLDEQLVAAWDKAEEIRKDRLRGELIELSEHGLGGDELDDELYAIDLADDGRLHLVIHVNGKIKVRLDRVFDHLEAREQLEHQLKQVFKDRMAIASKGSAASRRNGG